MSFKALAVLPVLAIVLTSSLPTERAEYQKQRNWLEVPLKTEETLAEKIEEPIVEEKQWPITKEQMASIMERPVETISDELMDDFGRMVEMFDFDKTNIAYFLGQVAAESGGLKHTIELDPGYRYEWRYDLGNRYQGDGVRYAGGGFLQLTGRANYTGFYRFMKSQGIDDPKILSEGKHHIAKHYPWTSGGWWWMAAGMMDYCKNNPSVDRVGARVNGKYLPNGYQHRRHYTSNAFRILEV